MKEFKVFSARIAGQLREQGFWIVRTEPNATKPWLRVFIFEDTEALRDAFSALMSENK